MTPQKDASAGVTAVGVSMDRAVRSMGVSRATRSLLKLNQVDGFDCLGCAWPDPDPGHRHTAEFCENGAKAVAEEATKLPGRSGVLRRALAWTTWSRTPTTGSASRAGSPSRWCGARAPPTTTPIDWDDAFRLVGSTLRTLGPPRRGDLLHRPAARPTRRPSLYQLFVRAFGTNNLPDCSNMCHESTSVALAEVIGIGKASVSLEDVHERRAHRHRRPEPRDQPPADAQRAGDRQAAGAPRSSPSTRCAEAGLARFRNPQTPRGLSGVGTELADLHLPVRVNGDLALFQAIGSLLVARRTPPGPPDDPARPRPRLHPQAHHRVRRVGGPRAGARLGRRRRRHAGWTAPRSSRPPTCSPTSKRTVTCWAMGITQHRNAVATIKEIANLAFAQGNIGKPGAGLCPGARALERPGRPHDGHLGEGPGPLPRRAARRVRLRAAPRARARHRRLGPRAARRQGPGLRRAGRQLRVRRARHRRRRGGDARRRPDGPGLDQAEPVARRLRADRADPAHRSVAPSGTATGGRDQRVSVEDSMSAVHASRGPLEPASPHLRSEVDVVCGLAQATVPGGRAASPGPTSAPTTGAVREAHRPRGPGLRRIRREGRPAGRIRPAAPAARHPDVPDRRSGLGIFTVSPTDVLHVPEGRPAAADAAQPRPVQHHDLRARGPLPRDPRRSRGGLRQPPRHRRPRASRTASSSTSSASGRTARSESRHGSASCPTTPRAGAPPPTTRRRTRWSRWTPRRSAATARPRSRSSSGW